MKRLDITEEDLADISEAIELPETEQRFRRKLLAVKMVAMGVKRELVLKTLDISHPTLVSYVGEYSAGGLAELLENRSYKPSSCLEEKLEEISAVFRAQPPSNAKHAREVIAQRFDTRLSVSQVRRLLKRIGMKFIKAGSAPGGADAQMQLDFLKGLLEPRIEQAEKGEIKLFFMDASHFLWGGHPGYSWCFERIWAKGASGRKRLSILGAVDAIGKDLHYVDTDGMVNGESVCSLLLNLRFAYPDQPICVALDNVPYHRSKIVKELAEGFGIELLYLPPYSPNLNIIERLWRWVKSDALSNRYHESYTLFRSAVIQSLEKAQGEKKNELESLLALNFQILNL